VRRASWSLGDLEFWPGSMLRCCDGGVSLCLDNMRPTHHNNVSAVTRDAIAALGAETLYRLLKLDGPDVEALRPHFASRAKAARERAATAAALVRDLEGVWSRVEASMDADPVSWSRTSGESDYRNHARVEVLRLVVCARTAADRASIEAKRRTAGIPRHDDKGATSTAHVGQQLVELVDRLKSHDSGRWTMKAVTGLIAASQHDWTVAPCSELAGRYARNIEGLSGWIKTRIGRERQARRKRVAQGTRAR